MSISEPRIMPFYNNGRSVYITPPAAESLGDTLSFYSSGDTFALVNDPTGQFAPQLLKNKNVKVIHSTALARYLKCACEKVGKKHLPAWNDTERGALLFSVRRRALIFSKENFAQPNLSQVRLCQSYEIVVGRVYLGENAPREAEAYECGDMLALRYKANGPLRGERTKSGGIFYSDSELVARLWKQWGEGSVFYREMADMIAFSTDFRRLADLKNTEAFRPIQLKEGRYLSLERDRTVKLSTEAMDELGRRMSVYVCGPYLALCPDQRGDLVFNEQDSGGHAASLRFYQQVLLDYPMEERLSLSPHGSLWVLHRTGEKPNLVPEQFFCRVLV